MMRVCIKCGIEKPLKDYVTKYSNGVIRYLLKCESCRGIQKVYSFSELNDIDSDIKLFIERVNKCGGWINEVDAFRLLSLYVDKFGIKYPKLNKEDELVWMWEELKKI